MAMIPHDGETHWMEGVQLLAVYVILALAFFFLPVFTGTTKVQYPLDVLAVSFPLR